MSKRHVKDYYMKTLADYTEMKTLLDDLQKDVTEDTASVLLESI